MDELSRHQIYGSQIYEGDVRVRQHCDTANYRNKTAYAGNHSLAFGNNLLTDKCCYNSQVSSFGHFRNGNGTTYREPGATSKQEINNNDIPSTHKVDKRALYSKYRVVKRKDQSQATNESTKVKPFLWRFRLGDKTIVDVNEQDGLPKVTKRAKVISTLTPVKENEAEATISNIEFITLDNMKVVRRKLEMVQLVRQEDERQERLKVEAEVKAKVKANAKVRMRTNKRHKDRRRGHV